MDEIGSMGILEKGLVKLAFKKLQKLGQINITKEDVENKIIYVNLDYIKDSGSVIVRTKLTGEYYDKFKELFVEEEGDKVEDAGDAGDAKEDN